MTDKPRDALVAAIDRLFRVGVGITTRVLAEEPGADLTLQQWRVLVLVADGTGPRVGDIAGRIGVSHPSASRLVRRLESAGLVRQEPDPQDGRASRVRATPLGDRVASAVLGRRRALIADALRQTRAPDPRLEAAINRTCEALDHLA